MEYLLTIPGRLDGQNAYIRAERPNRYGGAKMKADNEMAVRRAVQQCLGGVRIEKPVYMEYLWVEKDRRRDKDNISPFGRKAIQDALVRSGILKDDGWDEAVGFSDAFQVDSENPRIEVLIREVEEAVR